MVISPIISSPINEVIGSPIGDPSGLSLPVTPIVGMGQSNEAQKFTVDSGAGAAAMVALLESYYPNATVAYINGADGGSFLTKTAADAAADTEIWWNNENDTEGQELTQWFVTANTNGGEVNIRFAPWAQGESDAGQLGSGGVLSQAEYLRSLNAMFTYVKTRCPTLSFVIQPLGRRGNDYAGEGYQAVIESQWSIADSRSDVILAPEVYDLALSDNVHIANYVPAAERVGLAILKARGKIINGASGAEIGTPTYLNDYTLRLPVTHDAGTAFAGSSNKTPAADKTGFISAWEGDAENSITSVTDNGTSIDIVLSSIPFAPFTVYGGKGNMWNVDDTKFFIDNSSNALPLRRFKKAVTGNTAGTGITSQDYSIALATSVTDNTATVGTAVTLSRSMAAPRGVKLAADDNTGTYRNWWIRHKMTSSTALYAERATGVTMTQTINAVGSAVEFPASIVNSIQSVEVAMSGTSDGTATISTVDTDFAVTQLPLYGWQSTSSTIAQNLHSCDLVDATTVSATKSVGANSTRRVYVNAFDFVEAAIESIQHFEINMTAAATSATYTLPASVVPRNTFILIRGIRKTAGSSNGASYNFGYPRLLDADTIQIERGNQNGTDTFTIYGTAVELVDGLINVQRGVSHLEGGDASGSQAILTAPAANSWLNVLGWKCEYNGSAEEGQIFPYIEQVNDTTLNYGKPSATSDIDIAWELITTL